MHCSRHLIVIVALLVSLQIGWATDWPQWRYDAGHGAATPHALPKQMHLQWSIQLEDPRPSWPTTQSKLGFDLATEPVVSDGRIFVPSSMRGTVSAYDTKNGK